MHKIIFRFVTSLLTAAILVSCSPPFSPSLTSTPQSAVSKLPQASQTATPREQNTPTNLPGTTGETIVIDPGNASQLQTVTQLDGKNPHLLKWSSDGATLAARTMDGMSLYDIPGQSTLAEVITEDNRPLLDFSPDTRLMATTRDQHTLELSDIESGMLESTLTPGYPIYNAFFLPGGKQIAILSANEMAFSIWDIDSAEKLNSYSGFESAAPVYAITISDDGKTAMWYARATVQTTHLSSGQMGPVLSHQEFIGGLDMVPEKNWLAAASATTTGSEPQALIQLWDASSGEEIGEFKGCEIIPISIDFSTDGKLLAADCRNKVIVWDANGFNILAELDSRADAVTSVKFSPDGTMLATAANDGKILIWKAQP